ncbi:MAG TPA: hypothetical protein ENK41_07035 [Rhodobacteraceae bacterium]|nr:hypothetical protein [Paracoccaceae bacterium]
MNFVTEIALPVLGLMTLAIGLPYLWALALPEGIPGLVANGLLSLAVIAGAVSAYVLIWYGGPGDVPLPALAAFLGLWLGKTALAWAPMLILGVAAQPRRWKEVVW